jgi:hypothetical protein
MESISEYLNLDPRVVFIVVVVAVLTVFFLVVKWLVAKTRDDSLYDDLDNRDDDDLDESEDDEEPEGRFFRVPSYNLPDDWDDTFEVIVDRKTKVQYLCYGDYGITPFIDADGKPILYKDEEEEQEESE